MLVNCGVHPNAVTESSGGWCEPEVHQRILENLLEHCVLVANGDDITKSDLWPAVDRLPQALRTLWQRLLPKVRWRPSTSRAKPLSQCETLKDIEQLATDNDIVCIDPLTAYLCELPEDWITYTPPASGPELVKLPAIDRSDRLRKRAEYRTAMIEAGISVIDLWSSRFKSIAAFGKAVSIVDRYAVGRMMEGHNGLPRLLKEIDGTASGAVVTVYSTYESTRSVFGGADCLAAVNAVSLGRGGVKEINMYLTSDSKFSQLSHCRLIRFDDVVCEIGTGVEVFDGSTIYRRSTFTAKRLQNEHRVLERDIRSEAGNPLVRSIP